MSLQSLSAQRDLLERAVSLEVPYCLQLRHDHNKGNAHSSSEAELCPSSPTHDVVLVYIRVSLILSFYGFGRELYSGMRRCQCGQNMLYINVQVGNIIVTRNQISSY